MNGATRNADWLEHYLVEAVRKNLCTKIRCTTCGALEFRKGLLTAAAKAIGRDRFEAFDETSAPVIIRSLATVNAPPAHLQPQMEEAVHLVLFDLWSSLMLQRHEHLLTGAWADGVLERMKAHYQAETERHRAIAESEDPVLVQRRREEERSLKQQKHQERLTLKKDRDRIWRQNQKKNES
jgi:hypothetical protein